MKKLIAMALALVTVLSMTACGAETSKSCAQCEKIAELQEEYDELSVYVFENRDMEGTKEFDTKEQEMYSVYDELQVLSQHACTMPAMNVENMEYRYGDFIGTYSGELKSNLPDGKGIFVGATDSGNSSISYTGQWSKGSIDGMGTFTKQTQYNGKFTYQGKFVNNKYHGEAFYRVLGTSSNDFAIREVCGNYVDGKFSGQGVFIEYDGNGNIIDYGKVSGEYYEKVASAKSEYEFKNKATVADNIFDIILGDDVDVSGYPDAAKDFINGSVEYYDYVCEYKKYIDNMVNG